MVSRFVRSRRPRARLLALLVVLVAAVSGLSAASAWAAAAPVAYGTANVDGDPAEWGSPPTGAIPMYEAGDPSKANPSNAYLRYSCSTQTMYVLVLGSPGFKLVDMSTAAWATVDSQTKRYTGASGDDGTPPDFRWIAASPAESISIDGVSYNVVNGYEASFPLAPGNYDNIVLHAEFAKNVVDGTGSGGTSANVGFRDTLGTTSLSLDCSTPVENPAITVVKSTNGEDANDAPGPYVSVGSAVSWSYLVTNSGDVALSSVSVSDSKGVAVSCPKTELAVGESMTCTASGAATAGQYENLGTASGTSPGGTGVQAGDPSHYYGVMDLSASKTASGSFDRTYQWSIAKTVDRTLVKQVGGTAAFNYSVSVTQTGYQDGNWTASGKITLDNPNSIPIGGIQVTDSVDNGGSCTVAGGSNLTLAADAQLALDYSCSWASQPSSSSGTNTASVSWSQPLTGSVTATAPFAFDNPTKETNKSITVTDTHAGTLGTLTATASAPLASATYTYVRTVSMPSSGCVSYDNTAKISETGQSSSQSVKVCGPARTGALTMGFWQNKNGQDIIKTGATTSGVCNSGTWLRQWAPFQDLSASASCSQVATYVTNVIKAASASGASMNAMLKAQMLATALDVYFSDPALGGNKLNASAPVGGVQIDLTKVCTDLTCTAYEDSSSVFGGSPKTVLQMLSYAAGQSNVGGSMWYGNAKLVQELAKDAFDVINNQLAFAA